MSREDRPGSLDDYRRRKASRLFWPPQDIDENTCWADKMVTF
jgi:hypothetical protein